MQPSIFLSIYLSSVAERPVTIGVDNFLKFCKYWFDSSGKGAILPLNKQTTFWSCTWISTFYTFDKHVHNNFIFKKIWQQRFTKNKMYPTQTTSVWYKIYCYRLGYLTQRSSTHCQCLACADRACCASKHSNCLSYSDFIILTYFHDIKLLCLFNGIFKIFEFLMANRFKYDFKIVLVPLCWHAKPHSAT